MTKLRKFNNSKMSRKKARHDAHVIFFWYNRFPPKNILLFSVCTHSLLYTTISLLFLPYFYWQAIRIILSSLLIPYFYTNNFFILFTFVVFLTLPIFHFAIDNYLNLHFNKHKKCLLVLSS